MHTMKCVPPDLAVEAGPLSSSRVLAPLAAKRSATTLPATPAPTMIASGPSSQYTSASSAFKSGEFTIGSRRSLSTRDERSRDGSHGRNARRSKPAQSRMHSRRKSWLEQWQEVQQCLSDRSHAGPSVFVPICVFAAKSPCLFLIMKAAPGKTRTLHVDELQTTSADRIT